MEVVWYKKLVSNSADGSQPLLEAYPEPLLRGKLLLCYTPRFINGYPAITPTGDSIKRFGVFETYIDFNRYQKQLNPEDRCFYEIILGSHPQKPHFDVDIKKSDMETKYPDSDWLETTRDLVSYLIKCCVDVLERAGVHLSLERDILLYSSSNDEKQSYHLVIDNYCHSDHKQAKGFYDEVIKELSIYVPENILDYIDPMVYSKKQQFRILGSQKVGSKRPKIFLEQYMYFDETIQWTMPDKWQSLPPASIDGLKLAASLVGFTSTCTMLPNFIDEDKINRVYDNEDLSTEQIENALALMNKVLDNPPFKYVKASGNIIILRREKPSGCPVCPPINGKEHVHEKEHPFLLVSRSRVLWYCRRNRDNRGLELQGSAYIQPVNNNNTQEDPDPQGPEQPRVDQVASLTEYKDTIDKRHDEELAKLSGLYCYDEPIQFEVYQPPVETKTEKKTIFRPHEGYVEVEMDCDPSYDITKLFYF